jgi:hypothetical protein
MRDESRPGLESARSASAEEIKSLIHSAEEEALLELLENSALDEEHVSQLLDRLDLPAKVLAGVAERREWVAKEGIRLRLARHPHTPRRISLSLLRQLYLFDLVRVSLLPSAPAEIRRVAEEIIIARIPHLPVGEKLTLARRGPARVAGAMLAEGHAQAVKLALGNTFLTESQVLKVLAKPGVPERVVAAISQHAKWWRQYNVRMALARNPKTPVPIVLEILPNLTLGDLKEIANLDTLAPHLRKYIQLEQSRRAGEAAATGN